MKKTIEKLWDDYFAPSYAVLDTEEEKAQAERAIQLQKKAHEELTKEQIEAVEKYVDAVCEIESGFTKKAFLKGCEFTSEFLLEAIGKKST